MPLDLPALIREALLDDAKATKGPWYFRCTDDAHHMNARMVSTEPSPIKSDCTYHHDGVARTDFEEAICVTLHQLMPRISRSDEKEEENAEFIANARTREPVLARLLDAALKVVAAGEQHRKTAEGGGLKGKMLCYCPTCDALRAFDALAEEMGK